MNPNATKAKRIITEILKQSPEGIGKTKLYKTFWVAHLFYAERQVGFLSDWPIVRMPMGPGIDRGESLVAELIDEGRVSVTNERVGPFVETRHHLGKSDEHPLPTEAVEAIKEAVAYIKPMSAEECSDLSHRFSRSWNQTSNGEEMDIYSDLIPDVEYGQRREEMKKLAAAMRAVLE